MGQPDSPSLHPPARSSDGSGLLPSLALCLAGGLQAVSLALPLALPALGLVRGEPVWWLQWLALSMLVHRLGRSVSARQAAWYGWLFAWGWLSTTFAWLYISMHTYGGLSAVLAVLAVLALAGVLALYYAAAAWAVKTLSPRGLWALAGVFAAVWLLAELARGVLFTGFGWGAVGYAQLDGPLATAIPWIGGYGVCALVAGCAAATARIWQAAQTRATRSTAVRGSVGLLLLLLVLQAVPAVDGGSAGGLDVTLLQGNIPQEEKFESASGVPQALRWYGEQLDTNRSALVITPETAVPVLPEQLPPGYWTALQQRFAGGAQAALVGVPLGNLSEGYTNSVVGFKPGQAQVWRYDKHHLVPFGEFIPPMFRWFTDLMAIPLGDFNRGPLPQPTFDWQGQRLAATVCYENLFSEELAAQFADAARAPTMLVNISNLGWFGEHLAMDQHLQIARMRALEFNRPFLLATNTGQTAIVDHLGRVQQRAPAHVATALTGEVQGRTGITPYAAWVASFGLWPLLILALIAVMVAAGARLRAGRV